MAAVVAAGITSVSAQVFSVNVVGYVQTTVRGGNLYSLIANPLDAGTNSSIATLFTDLPAGSTVYKWSGAGFAQFNKNPINGTFPANASTTTLVPGEGVFVQSSSVSNVTITFVGEVQQGILTNSMPVGFSIISSRVPLAGSVSSLGYTNAVGGDTIYKWDATTQGYSQFNFVAIGAGIWSPSEPTLSVGEAVFINKTTAGAWVRNYVVP